MLYCVITKVLVITSVLIVHASTWVMSSSMQSFTHRGSCAEWRIPPSRCHAHTHLLQPYRSCNTRRKICVTAVQQDQAAVFQIPDSRDEAVSTRKPTYLFQIYTRSTYAHEVMHTDVCLFYSVSHCQPLQQGCVAAGECVCSSIPAADQGVVWCQEEVHKGINW